LGFNEIWPIVLGILASIGGIGAVFVTVIKFSSKTIAKRLEEEYNLKLDKELKRYKSSLSNKIYISKVRIDAEFAVYRELSKAFFGVVDCINAIFPYSIPCESSVYFYDDNQKAYEKSSCDKALAAINLAQDSLSTNAPFITAELFEQYNEILELCNLQLWVFSDILIPMDRADLAPEDFAKTKEINEKFKILNENVRKYISKLDVLD